MEKHAFSSLMYEFKLMMDKEDVYSSSMELLFDICLELHFRQAHIPLDWGFIPPACYDDPRDKESYYFEMLDEMELEGLIKMGNILSKFIDALVRRNLNGK